MRGASPSDSSSISSSAGFAATGPSEREHLLLAARQQAGDATEQGLELREDLDRVGDRDAGDPEVVGGGELHEHRPLFGDEPHAQPSPSVQRRLRREAVEGDLAGDRRELTREREQRRRLPGPVRAHQRDDLAGFDAEVDVAHDRHRAVPGGETSALEQRTPVAVTSAALAS